jgi:hypothetical protein
VSGITRRKKLAQAEQHARRELALNNLGAPISTRPYTLWQRALKIVGDQWPRQPLTQPNKSPWRRTPNGWKLNPDWEHLRAFLPNYNVRNSWTLDERRMHEYLVIHERRRYDRNYTNTPPEVTRDYDPWNLNGT